MIGKNNIYDPAVTLETMTKCCRPTCDRYISQQGGNRMSQPFFNDHCSLYCWKISSVPSIISYAEKLVAQDPLKPNPPIEHNCECCGSKFTLNYAHNWANQIFCSKECQHKTYSGKRIKHTIKILQFLKTKQLIDSTSSVLTGSSCSDESELRAGNHVIPTGWTAAEISYKLNSVHPTLMLTPGGVVQRILPLLAKGYICKVPKKSEWSREPTQYYFNPAHQSEPIRSLIHRKV